MNMRRMRNFYLEMASRDIFAFHIWHSRQECQIAEQIFITVWQTKWRPKVDTLFPRSLPPPSHSSFYSLGREKLVLILNCNIDRTNITITNDCETRSVSEMLISIVFACGD